MNTLRPEPKRIRPLIWLFVLLALGLCLGLLSVNVIIPNPQSSAFLREQLSSQSNTQRTAPALNFARRHKALHDARDPNLDLVREMIQDRTTWLDTPDRFISK